MSLTVELPPEVESIVNAEAERRGLSLSDYLERLILQAREQVFLDGILHDLVGQIRYLEVLALDAERGLTHDPSGTLAAELTLLGQRCANLVGMTRPEMPLYLSMASFNVLDLVRKTVALFAFRAEQRKLVLQLHLPEQSLVLRSDRSALSRLLTNILDNAIRFSVPAGARGRDRMVHVRVNRRDIAGAVEVSITNFGLGILPDELKSGAIFEYGWRGRLAEAMHLGGSGIGLAESRRLARALGARLVVESKPVDGGTQHYLTSVTLTLPSTPGDSC